LSAPTTVQIYKENFIHMRMSVGMFLLSGLPRPIQLIIPGHFSHALTSTCLCECAYA